MKIFRSVDLAWQFRLAVVALALALLAPGSAYAAANKEHAQLMAEIRMLQEQQQQLQAMLGNLGDAMKALSAKLDDQAGATRKAMADQALTLNGIGDTVRVLREKVDDTTVRVSSVSQEIAQPEFQFFQAGRYFRFAIERPFCFLRSSSRERCFVRLGNGFLCDLAFAFRLLIAFRQPLGGPRGLGCIACCGLVGDEQEQAERVFAGKLPARTTAFESRLA